MDAETYITTHWIPRRIWTHLAWPRHQDRLRRCAELMPARGRTLDVGCACGHSTEIMRRFRPELEWAGTDFSKTAIERARARFPGLDFFHARTWRDLLNRKFDGVVCSEVLEHAQDDAGLAEALMRITADTLVLTTPWTRVSDPGHLRVYQEIDLLALFGGPNSRGRPEFSRVGQFTFMVWRREG